MIRIVGFYKGTFVSGEYFVRDGDDMQALKTLLRDFTGAVVADRMHVLPLLYGRLPDEDFDSGRVPGGQYDAFI